MKGIDVSNHNGRIDWNKLKNSDVKVVYIKASEGTTYQDPYLNEHYQGAKAIGLPTGFYHYLKGTSAPESQAQNFWSLIKDKENNLIPCLDIEENGFDVMDYALRFISKFKELSNLPILIYTGPYFANYNLDNRLASYPCWIAHYGVSSPMATKIWGTNYVGHQYTEKGRVPGLNGNVDLNNFTEGIFIDNSTVQAPKTTQATGKVAELQGLCNSILGTNLKIDNLWGPKTNDAVKRLPLCGLPYIQRELTTWVQLRLGVVPDGIFGIRTESAVKDWQRKNALKVDGIVGYNTYKSLATA